jgi:hypothetical protein
VIARRQREIPPHPRLRAIAVIATLVASLAAGAAQARPPEGSELQLFIENDLLARTDRYYTNGIKFGGGASFDLLQLPANEILEAIAPKASSEVRFGLFLGQNLYTPRTITVSRAAARPAMGRLALPRRRGAAGDAEPPRHG